MRTQNIRTERVGIPTTPWRQPCEPTHAAVPHRAGSPDPAPSSDTSLGSYISQNGADPKTVGLLITATEYAVAAVQRIIQQSTGSPEALHGVLENYVDLVFGLEVNFVFPNLTSSHRDLLVSLMKVRNGLGVQLSGRQQWRTPDQKTEHDRLTTDLKNHFAGLCREIAASHLEDRLDDVQKQVLKEEFLSVILDKEDNTKLFFRKKAERLNGCTAKAAEPSSEAAPEATVPAQAAAVDATPTQGPSKTSPASRKKVLIIDRSEREAQRIARWLRDAGYEAIVGEAGFESCRQAMREKPHLILMEFTARICDWPGDSVMDGETTFRVLERIPKAQGTPVLAMANPEDPTVRQAALKSGALACLSKPLEQNHLLKAIRVALDDLEAKPELVPAAVTN